MRPFPASYAAADLPDRVSVYEVGPRDGLQAEQRIVPAETKIRFIRQLEQAGLRAIETTSFVSPKWIPQLADAEQVIDGLARDPDIRYPVLVPNARGLDRAFACGAVATDSGEVAIFVSATEAFARANLASTVDGALAMAEPVVTRASASGIRVRGYVSMCFGDPWEGRVDPRQVADVSVRLVDLGCATISLGDTIGVATPGHVAALLDAHRERGISLDRVALHFHDTYGQALANVLAGLQAGVTEFDASAGGLGGCPYAKSATGNLATEDLVWMLHGLGIETGVDLDRLVETSVWMAGELGRPAPSRVVTALQ